MAPLMTPTPSAPDSPITLEVIDAVSVASMVAAAVETTSAFET